MNAASEKSEPVKIHPRNKYPQLFDWVSMAVYVLLVYGWALNAYPMGRDYAEQNLPSGLSHTWNALQGMLGDTFWFYHAVNMFLLYGCMIAIFYLMRLVHGGRWWLGTLAAVLFMANPVHTESMLNLCGMADLLPCFLALVALNVYVLAAKREQMGWLVLAVPLYALAALMAPANVGLFVVFLLLELLLVSGKVSGRVGRLAAMVTIAVCAGWLHRDNLFPYGGDVGVMFGPLYFILYPIGFLPSTVESLITYAWLGWLAAAVVVAILLLIYRRARNPVILLGLLSMVAVRLFGGEREIDSVHLIGGGQLLLANAFFVIGLTALFHRMMEHPKWRRITVTGTSLLCVLFMVMQVHAIYQWRMAGRLLRDFHGQVRQAPSEQGSERSVESLLVSPDIQYVEGAPVMLSDSLVFDDRFIPYTPDLGECPANILRGPRLNVFEREGVRMQTTLEDGVVTVLVEGTEPVQTVPFDTPSDYRVETGKTGFSVEMPAPTGEGHLIVLPGHFPWNSPDSQ